MQIGFEGLIIISTTIIVSYIIYSTYFDNNVEAVKSNLDNKEYYVQSDKENPVDAANLLAEIRKRLLLLVEHIYKNYPSDERVIRIRKNFNSDALTEGADDIKGVTSYTINKSKITLCLRNDGHLIDINTAMFVAIHELGHVATNETHHTPLFWNNFRWLLEEAINIGIYIYISYSEHPEPYCNMMITSNPLDQ